MELYSGGRQRGSQDSNENMVQGNGSRFMAPSPPPHHHPSTNNNADSSFAAYRLASYIITSGGVSSSFGSTNIRSV
jgi:hypothetical protein